ncbi:MAG TPA: 2-phosphosulfolactate phosphatase [Candidatus Limnocylindria bacterium]
MRVTRTSLYEGARDATGTAVIIDVYRAFTTAAFCIAAGATEVILTASHGAALKLKAKDPTLFLTGEIGGKPIPGFDVGNSPSKIEGLDLGGRRVVQRTSAGTQGVVAAANAERVVLGSFVIAAATARYLRSIGGDITLVAMGDDGAVKTAEDELCATYLEALLAGKEPPIVPKLMRFTDQADWPDWFPMRDALLAGEVDRFDFALPVTREDGLLIARPTFS